MSGSMDGVRLRGREEVEGVDRAARVVEGRPAR